MKGVWTRGPRCGVENCKSRLYRIVDGRKVCRNGHVQQGDFQAGEDDEDFFSQGRRLAIPSQQRPIQPVKEDGILYGKEASALLMQCLQLLIRMQVEWLINRQGIRSELEDVVKSLWAVYVSTTNFSGLKFDIGKEQLEGHVSQSQMSNDSSNSRMSSALNYGQRDLSITAEDKEQDVQNPDSGEESEHNIDESLSDTDVELLEDEIDSDQDISEGPIISEKIQLLHTVCICYIGCLILRVPLFIYDFHRWIYRYQFPYMKSFSLVPTDMKRKLPSFYIRLLTAGVPPSNGTLHMEVQNLLILFCTKFNLDIPTPCWEPLLFKMVHDLFLPPEIYVASKKLIELLEIRICHETKFQTRYKRNWPDLQLITIVIICIKVCYGLDQTIRIPQSPSEPASQVVNWELWEDMLRKVWIEDESLSEADERDVLYWDKSKIDRYLSWFEENLIVPGEPPLAKKRLLDLFPLDIVSDDRSSTKSSVVPLPNTVAEIIRVVQSSTDNFSYNGSADDISYAGTILTPGARYQSQKPVSDGPDILMTLYNTCARMCAVNIGTIRGSIYHLELQCRQTINRKDPKA